MTHTIDGQMGTLRYIADSPPEAHGGFSAQTVDAAKWALAEIERLQSENERLKDSLKQIMNLSQQTCVSFECQSFQAFDIAGTALGLQAVVEGGKELNL